MVIVHVSCRTGLMFDPIQGGGCLGGEAHQETRVLWEAASLPMFYEFAKRFDPPSVQKRKNVIWVNSSQNFSPVLDFSKHEACTT